MVQLDLKLPDSLAREAQAAGLLQIRPYELDDFAFVVYDQNLVWHGE